ncbi:MAG TPA: gephyrin-like molybdotransferase Glp [Pirellulales bacterium]|jgi:molybdopterin molybdotransferase|nr:gephyrin-like molybdotransferase Glp [Pirellulales bacterium]
MLSLDEALALVLTRAQPLPPVELEVSAALGRILAADVISDIDSPPHDKAMVDGYAVVAADLQSAPVDLIVLEDVTAGDVPTIAVRSGCASRVMTGAPIPRGADAMVMIERTTPLTYPAKWEPRRADPRPPLPSTVRIEAAPVAPGQNILRRGVALRTGEVALRAGAKIRPIEAGILAEIGRTVVPASPRVRVAVLSTGNELVPPAEFPAAGQIRNSNEALLAAAVELNGGVAVRLGIARDEPAALREKISAGLEQADMLLLSGGVSAGVLDLVPNLLEQLGVREVFHKVRLKPGKPIWFGTFASQTDEGSPREKLVFGLPGNPVGSFVCFEVFVRPALRRLAGEDADESAPGLTATLTEPFQHRGERPTFQPAWLALDRADEPSTETGCHANVTALRWHGSADLRTLAQANALIVFPAGDRAYAAGDAVRVRLIGY